MNVIVPEITTSLKVYAAFHIAKLSETDPSLRPLKLLVGERFGNAKDDEIMSRREAEGYIRIPGSIEDFPDDLFDSRMLQDCYDIAIKVIEMASNTDSINSHMVEIVQFLHPLFSLDASTVMVGHDLTEYIDWYFADDVPEDERKSYFNELVADWEYLRDKAGAS